MRMAYNVTCMQLHKYVVDYCFDVAIDITFRHLLSFHGQ